MTNIYGILDTLNMLDAVCSSEDAEPDPYREPSLGTQVQQRFWMISGSAMLVMPRPHPPR